jgi:hypothetical protein
MKLRVHYQYGFGKIKKKDFGPMVGTELNSLSAEVASQRKNRGNITFDDKNCQGFSLPAESIVLMEVID